MGFDRIFLFFWIILLHTLMGNAISFLFLSKIIPIFQLQRLGGLYHQTQGWNDSSNHKCPPVEGVNGPVKSIAMHWK